MIAILLMLNAEDAGKVAGCAILGTVLFLSIGYLMDKIDTWKSNRKQKMGE